MFDKLQQLGSPHIPNFDQADKEQVFKCIRDRTGRFLTQDEFVLYVETEEEIEKPKYNFTGDAREALQDYYNAVHMLCEAQTNFARSTQVLEQQIADKSIFLSVIQQVQLPAVQVQVRMVEEMEKLEGKTYRELTLSQHLPNFRAIYPNTTEQTRMMAAYIYFVLYEQITGLKPSQTGCATEFRCGTTPFKRLITGKKQPGGPSRSSETRGGSSRKLEEVAKMEGVTPTKQKESNQVNNSDQASSTRAKSAFVVPMGKWEFKRTPFRLSQAPAYFQLLIDKVLMGCSKFAMGYLDDIIIFSNNKIEHLRHIEEIFTRLECFGLKMKREKCDFF